MTLHIPSISTEYLRVPVTGDYTEAMPVEIAVVQSDAEPAGTDWATALWDSGDAKLLVGTGGLVLGEGLYGVWVRITATPEVVVLLAGSLRIT